ncbi:sporulation protein [Bacillus safensis]|uniref:sporulation protein n=1 Tax=Bacillus safensis TaxID=561879 RepID=UPI002237E992|nr:sporulation protein [Bacillus safensis]MCW4642865.1 sporulation protein [Bacillus safensis]MCY7563860.1 sporulation protein [Bacillus safensis]MCY7626373.1 sporulation protein [Bacillus safensis]MCY7632475.1 sporulation protein [Bacillus safensis]MCY7646888.1 sporulation protein [Bacillus safensis]
MKKILAGVVIFGLLLITFFYVFSRTSEIFDENRAEKLLLSPANKAISYEIDDKDTVEDLIEELNKGKQTSNHLKKNLKKPDYIAKVMFGRTNGTTFQLWTSRSQVVFLVDGTFYELNQKQSNSFQRQLKEAIQKS